MKVFWDADSRSASLIYLRVSLIYQNQILYIIAQQILQSNTPSCGERLPFLVLVFISTRQLFSSVAFTVKV